MEGRNEMRGQGTINGGPVTTNNRQVGNNRGDSNRELRGPGNSCMDRLEKRKLEGRELVEGWQQVR